MLSENTYGDITLTPIVQPIPGAVRRDTGSKLFTDGMAADELLETGVLVQMNGENTDIGPVVLSGNGKSYELTVDGTCKYAMHLPSGSYSISSDRYGNLGSVDAGGTQIISFDSIDIKVRGIDAWAVELKSGENDGPHLDQASGSGSGDSAETIWHNVRQTQSGDLNSYNVYVNGESTGISAAYQSVTTVQYHTLTVELSDSPARQVFLKNGDTAIAMPRDSSGKVFTYTAPADDTEYTIVVDGTEIAPTVGKADFASTHTVSVPYKKATATVTVKLDGTAADLGIAPMIGENFMEETGEAGVYTYTSVNGSAQDVTIGDATALTAYMPDAVDGVINYYTVTYEKSGAESGMLPAESGRYYLAGTELTMPESGLSNGVQYFGGWNIGGTVYEAGDAVTVDSTLAATATWQKQPLNKPMNDGRVITMRMEGEPVSFVYNGRSQRPSVTLYAGDEILSDITDYDLSYVNSNTNYVTGGIMDTTHAGTITVTATGKGDFSGTLTGTYEITPLTVKADDKVIVYRHADTLPELTYSITGIIPGHNASEVVSGSLATAANVNSPAGEYDITEGTLSIAGAHSDYTMQFVKGKLTILKAAQDAPAAGEGYTVTNDRLSIKNDRNSEANSETYYEISDGTNTYAHGATFVIDEDKNYRIRWAGSANYEPSPWVNVLAHVTVAANPYPTDFGEITGLSEDGKYAFGAAVTLTATPADAEKYRFIGWQDESGRQVSTDSDYTFIAKRDVYLTATFAEKEKTVAAFPTVTDYYIYDGYMKVGVSGGTNCIITGDTEAINAGGYVAVAKLNENCVWPDGTTANLKLAWKIDKAQQAKPIVTVSGSTITFTGSTDNIQYSTDGGRTWTDGAVLTGEDGATYYFRYAETENKFPSPATIVKVNVPPTVKTVTASTSLLTSSSAIATLYGMVSKPDEVSTVGFKYRKAGESTWTDATAGSAAKAFSVNLTGLTPDTDYVFRAVATYAGGTITGIDAAFHTPKVQQTAAGSIEVIVNDGNSGRGVIVSIEAGNDAIASKSGTANCTAAFTGLPDGFYNAVVRTADGDYTETRMTEVKEGSAETVTFEIPVGKLATVVDVKTEDTPKTAVEGLNELITATEKNAAASGEKDIEVKLEVEKKAESNAAGAADIKNNLSGGEKVDAYLDLSLYKTVTALDAQGEPESVETTDIGATNTTVLEIAIPYANANRQGLKMYRFHNFVAELLRPLAEKPLGGFIDGTYYVADNHIFLYASGFSTYAIVTPTSSGGKKHAATTESAVGLTPGAVSVNFAECKKDESCPIWPFIDASTTEWYHDGVHWAIDESVMRGYGDSLFGPNDATTRAQVAQMLYNIESKPETGGAAIPFTDVESGMWYADAIGWAAGKGVVVGFERNGVDVFDPNAPVTREQFAAMMQRYAKTKGADVSANTETNLQNYSDAGSVSLWATDALRWAVEKKLITGRTEETLVPLGTATRAEIATILMRYFSNEYLWLRGMKSVP